MRLPSRRAAAAVPGGAPRAVRGARAKLRGVGSSALDAGGFRRSCGAGPRALSGGGGEGRRAQGGGGEAEGRRAPGCGGEGSLLLLTLLAAAGAGLGGALEN